MEMLLSSRGRGVGRLKFHCICALVAAFAAVAGAVDAQSNSLDRQISVDIAPQPLPDALIEFSKQAGVQVITPAPIVSDLKTEGVHGQMSLGDALARLLKGTKLGFHPAGANIIGIDGARSSLDSASQVAQTGGVVSESPPAGTAGVDQMGTTPGAKSKEEIQKLEGVVVTGSRIPRTAKEGSQEVRTYTKEQIDNSGQTTIADFLSTLPEVSTVSIDSPVGNFADQTTVRLHGLPTGTTLVLLNGRRVEINNYGFFDLNNIPISAIERVEVMPVGSSAIYGADSLAGTVNIILKNDFDGFEANAKYGHASGTDETDATLAWGKNWERGEVLVTGSYQGRSVLMGSERGPTASNPPGSYYASIGLDDICTPGTVYSENGGNLPGLSAPTAGIPAGGISGTPTIQNFKATAGKINKCSYNDFMALLSPVDREGLLASGNYRLSDSFKPFFEILYTHEIVNSPIGGTLALSGLDGAILGAGNPYNPFGVAVGLGYNAPALPATYDRMTTFARPLIGVRGGLAGDWNYEVTGFISGDRSRVGENQANPTAFFSALSSTNPATAFNPFASGPPGSPQLLASLIQTSVLKFTSQNITTQGLLRGTLFRLPSGPIEAVFGAEYDRSKIHTDQLDEQISTMSFTATRDAYALFTEERVPLLANHAHPQNGEKLAISLAGRFDSSDDFGNKVTGQAGVEWRPNEAFLVRGAYSTSYQAPQLPQLAGSFAIFSEGALTDPSRGNMAIVVPVETGPNRDLRPETGQSRSFGIVYSSKTLPGFEASLNYWAIDITNYIGTPTPQEVIDNPGLYPGGVVRGPPSQQDMQNGYPGPITRINDLYYNFGNLNVAGFDWDLSYTSRTAFGRITPSISVTDTYRYNTALAPGQPVISNLNQASTTVGFAPRFKGTAAVNWKQGAYSATFDGRYVGNYNDYAGFGGTRPSDIGNFWLYDANFRCAIGTLLAGDDRWLKGSYVEVGGINLLNSSPPSSSFPYGYDPAEFDIRERFLYVQLGVKW
jgi:iron complex outermembrane receptor protein